MKITVKEGLQKNGIQTGKRQFRDWDKVMEEDPFRDPMELLKNIAIILISLIYLPIKILINYFTTQPKSLRGKICLVTGSGRGLGRELCLALAREGAILACADINSETNSETMKLLTEMGAKAKSYQLNVAITKDVNETIMKIEKDLGPIYLLLNNAAIVLPRSNPDEDFIRAVYNVNTMGPMWTTLAVLPLMKKRNEGHIVNISSIAAAYGSPYLWPYSASKAALTSFTQSLRMELLLSGQKNINFTCVHPSFINTSADYVDLLKSRLKIHEIMEVVDYVINAIKNNKKDCSPSWIYSLLKIAPMLFEYDLLVKFIQLFDLNIVLPTREEASQLPVGEIVEKSSKISSS